MTKKAFNPPPPSSGGTPICEAEWVCTAVNRMVFGLLRLGECVETRTFW